MPSVISSRRWWDFVPWATLGRVTKSVGSCRQGDRLRRCTHAASSRRPRGAREVFRNLPRRTRRGNPLHAPGPPSSSFAGSGRSRAASPTSDLDGAPAGRPEGPRAALERSIRSLANHPGTEGPSRSSSAISPARLRREERPRAARARSRKDVVLDVALGLKSRTAQPQSQACVRSAATWAWDPRSSSARTRWRRRGELVGSAGRRSKCRFAWRAADVHGGTERIR